MTSSVICAELLERHGARCRFLPRSIDTVNGEVDASVRNASTSRMDELARLSGLPHPVWYMSQVHGTDIVRVYRENRSREVPACDGLITSERGISLAVRTADCLPVFLFAPAVPIAAALHLGWRSLIGGLLRKAAAEIRHVWSVEPPNCLAAVGPGISARNYAVGQDLIQALRKAEPELSSRCLSRGTDGETRLDLRGLVLEQLGDMGFLDENVENIDICTFENEESFFSNRRDGGVLGLNMSAIGLLF